MLSDTGSGLADPESIPLAVHKTVVMFVHHVPAGNKPARDATERMANQRLTMIGAPRFMEVTA